MEGKLGSGEGCWGPLMLIFGPELLPLILTWNNEGGGQRKILNLQPEQSC